MDEGYLPADYVASDDPDRPVRVFIKPDDIAIVVAGDPGRNQSRGYMANHEQGPRVSQRIDLPRDWDRLLEEGRG